MLTSITSKMNNHDISESNTAEEKNDTTSYYFKEQLHDPAKILEFALDLICSFDEEGRFIWVNKASEHILGYKPEELIDKKYSDFIFDENKLNQNFDFRSETHSSIFEKKFTHKNTNIIYLQWSAVWDDAEKLCYCIARDVTEKKNIEKTFEIERLQFFNIYSQAPSYMGILKGPDHIYELANELYLQLIDKKDIIGKSVKEVLPELETQGIFEILDNVYQTGESFSAKEMLIKFDQFSTGKLKDVYLNFVFQASRDVNDTIDGILIFGNDVTEQVLSRKKIEESETMYKNLIHNLPVATYSCDADGRIVLYNKAAALLWGREPELGKDLWCNSWKSTINHPALFNLCSLVTALKEEDPILSEEIIIERPNGDKRNALLYPVPFQNTQGGITGAVIVLSDITEMKLAQKELKKSEKKYRYLFDNNPMPMWIIDLVSFKFLDVNKMAILQYGYSREEFLSMTALDIRQDDDKIHFLKSSDASKIDKSNYNRGIWNHIKKDGTIIPVEIIAHNITYEGTSARLILSNDISGRKKAETNLEKRNQELIKSNAELDRFVYSVSHDLRSPLTSILGLISFIETESSERDTLKHAELIRISINRLDDFIKNILSYSRNNRTGLKVEQISLNEMMLDTADSLKRMKEAEGIQFEIKIKQQNPFYTDRFRFTTIIKNLISNAIKYHKKEDAGRFIKISGYADQENFHFSIADNGIGIDPAYHQRIFEMFFRLSGKDGSGIGLYIVKDAVEILQGSIEVHSEKGIGTKFNITLKNLKLC